MVDISKKQLIVFYLKLIKNYELLIIGHNVLQIIQKLLLINIKHSKIKSYLSKT